MLGSLPAPAGVPAIPGGHPVPQTEKLKEAKQAGIFFKYQVMKIFEDMNAGCFRRSIARHLDFCGRDTPVTVRGAL